VGEHVHRDIRLNEAISNLVRVAREDQAERETEVILLGDLIQREREGWGLSMRDLEHKSGVSRSMISRLERHSNLNPTVCDLSRLAEALSCPPVKLFEAALHSRRIFDPEFLNG
jgi:ribosome-binding protein aMBF1 (putative translation factor)